VKALDADGGRNGRVRYSLGDDVSPSIIYVDERTGVLRLSASLDRERTDKMEFTVWATDSADEPKSASAEVSAFAARRACSARPPCLFFCLFITLMFCIKTVGLIELFTHLSIH